MEETRGLYIYEVMMLIPASLPISVSLRIDENYMAHLRFRYGSDLDALEKYDAGEYAYWLAAGISVDYTKPMLRTVYSLFCKENLSE